MKISHDLLEGSGNGSLKQSKPVLITGGAGFIGTNVAHRYLQRGQSVVLFDNLSRPGVERNVQWLRETYGNLVQLNQADIRDAAAIRRAVKGCSQVFHFAAQVAVTTSLTEPILDFEVNARGTLNLLEALRSMDTPPPLLFTSSNKVYGDLSDVKIQRRDARCEPMDARIRKYGFSEERPLQFHSPYGCSKGAAGQYVLDYARTFDLPAVVFHMSCIYGPHQFGNEDQGWIAHFLIRALEQSPITIYGDGRQVRDVLFVEDLVNAFLLAQENITTLSGQSFNIGGGPGNTISLLEIIQLIAELNEAKPRIHFDEWRSADQEYYVSDIRKFSKATGWHPRVKVKEGVEKLFQWLTHERLATIRVIKPALNRVSRDTSARNGQTKRLRSKKLYQRTADSSHALIAV
jgi:CDP-paratose 2-epimerase